MATATNPKGSARLRILKVMRRMESMRKEKKAKRRKKKKVLTRRRKMKKMMRRKKVITDLKQIENCKLTTMTRSKISYMFLGHSNKINSPPQNRFQNKKS